MKRNPNHLAKPLWLFVILFFFHTARAQLDNFSLTVSHTDESCTANGTLTFSVNNTTPGATMLYTVYLLPDTTTPVAVLSANTITGLVAGNYRVVATQSLGGQSGVKQQDVTIEDTIVPLDYFVSGIDEICGNDGQILINTTSGISVEYEIISGPVTRPIQEEAVFSDLPAGIYIVRVFDNCGEGLVRNFTLGSSVPAIGFDTFQDLVDCTTLAVTGYLTSGPGQVIKYPVTVQVTITQPSGPVIYNYTIGSGTSNSAQFDFDDIQIELDQTYNAHFEATDGCGNFFEDDITLAAPELSIAPGILQALGCNDYMLKIIPIDAIGQVTVDFLLAPPGFDPEIYNPAHPGPFSPSSSGIVYYNPSILLPQGIYTIQITDSCGRVATKTVNVVFASSPGLNYADALPGCAAGMGSMSLQNTNGIAGAQIMSAPAGFPYALPFSLDLFMEPGSGVVKIGSLPEGDYQINILDNCNFTSVVTVHVIGYQSGATLTSIEENCDSFDFHFSHSDNLPHKFFWLQRFNPETNLWCHPVTGNAIPPGVITTTNAQFVNNNTTTTIQSGGKFRLVKTFQVLDQEQPCTEVIHTFEYSFGPQITRVYAIVCNSGTYETLVEATGNAPLTYRITTKNGQPFVVNNGTSALFSGLEAAVYTFQVEDGCGNILNSVFEVSDTVLFSVRPVNLCQGQPGQLTVPQFPFLNYQWWKEGNPATILSTTNSLAFTPFDASADSGLYHVRVIYPDQSSCIDLVLDFDVSPSLGTPHAGNDAAITYCGPQGSINLFGLLSGTVDNFGQWEETTASGLLNGYVWDSDLAAPGDYHFKYTVTGLCAAVDDSTVDITVLALPPLPEADAPGQVCEDESLQLHVSDIAGATYHWSGPNGFSSSEQNPLIGNLSAANAGTYSVSAVVNGCTTEDVSVTVAVAASPKFSLAAECIDGAFVLTATPIGNPFGPEVSYLWSGPENFAFAGNPATITGLAGGLYSLTVSSPEDCQYTSAIDIPNTLCGIPKGISPDGNGENDNWDLSGLDIKNVKIFNRYGMLVYEKARYVNEWNGQDKHGRELPSATYYYLIEFESGQTESGWVYLIRKN